MGAPGVDATTDRGADLDAGRYRRVVGSLLALYVLCLAGAVLAVPAGLVWRSTGW